MVTFVFTDVEGSTRLLQELGSEQYAAALAEHRRVLREAFAGHAGVEVDTQGDAFFVAFPTASGALAAASEATSALTAGPIRVRIGIHTGTPQLGEEGYVGVDVHRAARIAAAGYGGQVLVSASTAALVDGLELLDLGEHRLKDLSRPERIYQLPGEEFPPLRSLYRTNLPVPATPFLGRERELLEVAGLLEQTRLLTLTGPGGTGKTRLALQAAAETSERYPDGVFWVPLDSVRDPALVLDFVAHAVGAGEKLANHIAAKSMLLLLDNFEHVIDAAVDLVSLLASCPNLQLLVTSREVLRVPGEQAYPVPTFEETDGIEFFLARARAADPGFVSSERVVELCARLEQLPLALELAAARVTVISPDQLLARLSGRLDLLKAGRGVDPRQQTLRATIEWSHGLLDAEEQRLFARLAVFRGGCTLESAEELCGADLDTLQSLVDKSLVRVRDDRFWMLETIRDYAMELLKASGDADELRDRHAEHFVALAEDAEPTLLGIQPAESLDRLDREEDNVRAALDWLESTGKTQLALRIGGSIWEYWCLRSNHIEGWKRLEHLLILDERPTMARAKALTGAAHLSAGAGVGLEMYRARAEQALELHRKLGDPWGIAFAEYQYADVVCDSGDFAAAQPLIEECIERFRKLGDEHRELQAMRLLAWSCNELGDSERYRILNEEILRRARAAADQEGEWWALCNLANVATSDGRHREAIALLEYAYRISLEIRDPGLVDMNIVRVARALALADEPATAARLFSLAETMHADYGWTYPGWFATQAKDALNRARAQLDAKTFRDAWAEGQALSPDDALALAHDVIQSTQE